LLLGFQNLHKSLSYIALIFTTSGTVIAALSQLDNPREVFVRDANTEYAVGRLQSEIDEALIDATAGIRGDQTGEFEIPQATIVKWRSDLTKILADAQGQSLAQVEKNGSPSKSPAADKPSQADRQPASGGANK
jgi:hypothetical protein